jgi:hypothetical protein
VQIAKEVGVSRPTVLLWRERYAAGGIAALEDRPRSGRPVGADQLRIALRTLQPPPAKLGAARWSSRLLATELGISNATVAKARRRYLLRPRSDGTFVFRVEPQLAVTVDDLGGLYLNPPDHAVFVCTRGEPRTAHFAAAELLTAVGSANAVPGGTRHHRHREFLRLLRQVAMSCPDVPLHVVCSNNAMHRHPEIEAWLATIPCVTIHVVPAAESWLNILEILFGIIDFDSVHELTTAIRRLIDGWDKRCQPFMWSAIHRSTGGNLTRTRPSQPN